MNAWLQLSLMSRCLLVMAAGTMLGGLLNFAIYRWAWHARSISPWSAPPAGAPPRRHTDRIPVVGWLGLRREALLHGAGFWIRPLLIELAMGIGLAVLYWWEVGQRALYAQPPIPPDMAPLLSLSPNVLQWQFFSHAVLLALMVVASFIDFDEKLIPDEVTVSGTILGLFLAAMAPASLLPHVAFEASPPLFGQILSEHGLPLLDNLGRQGYAMPLLCTGPLPWPESLAGRPHWGSLALGLGCFWFWCFAIVPRPWYGRHGMCRGLAIAIARMRRGLRHPLRMAILGSGTAGVPLVWFWGDAAWASLLTALVGLVGGGGIIWAVRLIGAVTLKKEAMGFGDVLLMMMIGTFIGWQASLIVFFLAPLAGLVIGVGQYVLRRDQEIPYGPFLCAATVLLLVRWPAFWHWVQPAFGIGWLVPTVLCICFGLMAILLFLMRMVRVLLSGTGS